MKHNLRQQRLREQRENRDDSGEPVVINLPHRDTPELVRAVLPLWLNQSHPTLIDVVDTGSTPDNFALLSRICAPLAPRVRLHRIALRTWSHFSEPVAIACELSQLYAETPRVLWSHVDVFPRSQDLVAYWSTLCNRTCPVVGYEISPRDHVPGWISQNWRGMVGHSLTMGYLPSIRACSWSYSVARDEIGMSDEDLESWDTEVTFNLCLKQAGIVPEIVGHDVNLEYLVDEWHAHARSYPGAVISNSPHAKIAEGWARAEIAIARQHAAEWGAS